MTKQEFLAMSLPYGLKLKSDPVFEDDRIYNFNGFEINEGIIHVSENEEDWHNEYVYFPILHPLSDLTKWIEHKGEKIVPLLELKWNRTINYYYSKRAESRVKQTGIRQETHIRKNDKRYLF